MAIVLASGEFVNHGSDNTTLDPIPAGPATFLARIYRTADGANQHIITKDAAFPSGFGFLADNGPGEGALRLIVFRATTNTDFVSVAGVIPLNTWKYVMATWDDAATPEVHLYISGVGGALAEVTYATQTNGAGAVGDASAANLYAGNLQRATTLPFKGWVDGIAIYNRVLSVAEGEAQRDDWETAQAGAALLTHYVDTTTLTDLSGNGNDGTITGGTNAEGWPVVVPPVVTAASPAIDYAGQLLLPMTIIGTGFVDGAVVTFSGTGITVRNTTFVSSTQIDVEIDIGRNAALTARNITVTNPDSGADTLTGGFEISISPWSDPFEVVADNGRMAVYEDTVHIVGTTGGNLVYRKSTDQGATWGTPVVIATATGNNPMLYASIIAGDGFLVVITRDGGDGGASTISARRSTDGGDTWSSPVTIISSSDDVKRIERAVSGQNIHIACGNAGLTIPFQGYVRSTDGGETWDALVKLDETDATYDSVGPGAIAAVGDVLHLVYAKRVLGADGRLIWYIRSTDNGDTWSVPVKIAGSPEVGFEQRRERIIADGQHVIVTWEGHINNPLPPAEIVVARSTNAGVAWQQPEIVTSAGRIASHQDEHYRPGGLVHFTWRQGDSINLAATDLVCWIRSLNYGVTWGRMEIACDMEGLENHVYNCRTTPDYVHSLSGSDAAGYQYTRRAVASAGVGGSDEELIVVIQSGAVIH